MGYRTQGLARPPLKYVVYRNESILVVLFQPEDNLFFTAVWAKLPAKVVLERLKRIDRKGLSRSEPRTQLLECSGIYAPLSQSSENLPDDFHRKIEIQHAVYGYYEIGLLEGCQ